MEEKKKNDAIKNVVIVILVVCVLVLGGLLLYKEVFAKKETNNTANTNVNQSTNANTTNHEEPKPLESVKININKKTNINGNLELVTTTNYDRFQLLYNGKLIKEFSSDFELNGWGYLLDNSLYNTDEFAYAYQIDNVIIFDVAIIRGMCSGKLVLIFDLNGNLLFDITKGSYENHNFTEYNCNDLQVDNKNITIYYNGGSCVSTGDETEYWQGPILEFKVEGTKLSLIKYTPGE